MPRTMRAARAHPGEAVMRLETLDVPQVENGDVLVRVAAANSVGDASAMIVVTTLLILPAVVLYLRLARHGRAGF